MNFTTKDELKIYYLCMQADGIISESETAIFSKICASAKVDDELKTQIISECRKELPKLTNDNSDAIIKIINNIIYDSPDNSFDSNSAINSEPLCIITQKTKQTELLWNLVNLSYADTVLSESEKTIINYLAKAFNFKSSILADIFDTAETILALSNEKEYLFTLPYSKGAPDIEYADKNIATLYNNMELLVQEADID